MIPGHRHWWVRLLSVCACVSFLMQAQQAGARRLVIRTSPVYPDLARSMALLGTVKVEVLVASDGSVKDVAVKAGHPVLAQAAINTVRRWKWEPAPTNLMK